MKKLILAAVLAFLFTFTTPATRPTPQYLVWYDNGESVVVNAWSLEEAVVIFSENYKFERIYGVNQISYVESRWIWLTEEVRKRR